jgi:predicted permease
MNELVRRLRYLVLRRRSDDELADELDFHREMAAREGRTNLGNSLRLREESRDAWGWTWLDRFAQDLRYAARMLLKSPGFSVAAITMLALGIGVNVAAFGFFNLIIFRALPVQDPDSLLSFQRRSPEAYAADFPYPVMAFYRENSRTLSAVMAVHNTNLVIEGAGKPIKAHFVTENYFRELGATARLGRTFDEATDEMVAVLSDGFWRRHFGGNPGIVGKTIRLNQQAVTVIGVAAHEFSGLNLNGPDVWLPITQQPLLLSGSDLLTTYGSVSAGVEMWGRLRPGLNPKAVEAEFRSLAAELKKQHPNDIWDKETVATEPGGYAKLNGSGQRGTGTPVSGRDKLFPIFLLIGSLVLLILAVSCGNLGSLLLARGVARQREIAIRVAVGAGSGRLVRQLFTESLLLAILGAVGGLGLGGVVLRYLMVFTEAPEWLDATPDWRVALFAVTMGFAAAVLFGLTPALQVARQRHRATLVRQLLIGAQVAASCILLIVAGLLVRAINHAVTMNPGFEYRQVISIQPDLDRHGYTPGRARTYLETMISRLRELPGVESVALVTSAPLGNRTSVLSTTVAGRPVGVHLNNIDPNYFATMKIPLVRGRNFKPGEMKAVIIGESFARLQWPGQDPIGKGFPVANEEHPIVGVAASARTGALNDPDAAEAYFPIATEDWSSLLVLVKASGPLEALVPQIGPLAKSIDAQVFPEVQMLKSSFRRKLENAERSAMAISVLGLTALALACLGIIGLVTYAVSQRTKEIGIRMALGAKQFDVLGSVLRQFSRPVILGLLIGVAGAAGLSQLLRRELYGISNLDPIAYLAAIGVFAGTALLAALWPARRALRVDPLRALRYE